MENTAKLLLPYITASQAQKHITHNEALKKLDIIVQLSVLDKDKNDAPAAPNESDMHIIASQASGEWAGKENQIAAYQNGAWIYYSPQNGWLAWVSNENKLLVWNDSTWSEISGSGGDGVNPTPLVGVNATADAINRLSISSQATLFNHEGDGHQLKINKNSSADNASSLYQTGFSGRAEMGLAGDDDFHFKVSPDGVNWIEAIVINKDSGSVRFPNAIISAQNNINLLINSDAQINQRGFAGGVLASGEFGFDRWYASGGIANISISNRNWHFTSGTLAQKIEPILWGYDDLASKTITVSVEGLSGGNLNIDVGSNSGTITAGSAQRSITITTDTGDVGNLIMKLTPTNGAVNFKNIKAEVGSIATPFVCRSLSDEIALAQRYYERISPSINERFAVGVVTNIINGHCRFPIRFKQQKPSSSISVGISAFAHFSIDGAGYLDIADGFNTISTSKDGAYVQFDNKIAQDADFAVGGTMLLSNTNNSWIDFDAEI
jgi:hypothetical protein